MSCPLKWPQPHCVLPRGPRTTQEGVQAGAESSERRAMQRRTAGPGGQCRVRAGAATWGTRASQAWRSQRARVRLAVGWGTSVGPVRWQEGGTPSPEAPAWQDSRGSACHGRWAGSRGLEESPRVCDEGTWPAMETAAWHTDCWEGRTTAVTQKSQQGRPRGSTLVQGTSVCGHPLTSVGRSPHPEGGDIPVDKTMETAHFRYR